MPLRLRDALREVEWHVVHLRGHRLADQVGLATRARRVVMQVKFARLAVQVRLGERARLAVQVRLAAQDRLAEQDARFGEQDRGRLGWQHNSDWQCRIG